MKKVNRIEWSATYNDGSVVGGGGGDILYGI